MLANTNLNISGFWFLSRLFETVIFAGLYYFSFTKIFFLILKKIHIAFYVLKANSNGAALILFDKPFVSLLCAHLFAAPAICLSIFGR